MYSPKNDRVSDFKKSQSPASLKRRSLQLPTPLRSQVRSPGFSTRLSTLVRQNGRPAYENIDLFSLLTRVNRKMSKILEEKHKNAFSRMKYKLPCVTSMLTKDLIFKHVN